jgi:hypothetical protein
MYGELLNEFQGLPVVDFNAADSWQGPQVAYRLREEYDDKASTVDRLVALTGQPGCDRLAALIVGAWSGACEGGDSTEIVAELVNAAPSLPGLRHLFFGEMTYDECEISWINQTNLSPLLVAFPKLESLRVRGGTGLAFPKVRHECLKELAIETGGLSRSTIRDVFQCDFPALEHLELLLGENGYGFDGGVEDLQPALSGRLYPKLKFLGLMNSEIANDIAAVLVNSPIAERVESLDLSLGNLDDEGVASLRGLADFANLRRLNISHHYGSPEAVVALKQALQCEVIADDPQDRDEEWRPIVHAE